MRVALLLRRRRRQDAARAARLRRSRQPARIRTAHGEGFENRIAELLAAETARAPCNTTGGRSAAALCGAPLGADMCDVLIGVPADFERVSTTRPYYRSSYVFVTRAGDAVARLRQRRHPQRRIGVQLIGNDMARHARRPCADPRRRHRQCHRFHRFSATVPAAQRMVDALDAGSIDAALVWGPQAGYFARPRSAPLQMRIASAPAGTPEPFAFDVALGVKRGNKALLAELDGALPRRARRHRHASWREYQVHAAAAADTGDATMKPPVPARCCPPAWRGCYREERPERPRRRPRRPSRRARLSEIEPGASAARAAVPNNTKKTPTPCRRENRCSANSIAAAATAQGGGGMGPALMDDKWIYGSEPANIYATIIEGRPNGMPAFGGHLTNEQVWQLVAYVRSMSGQVSEDAAPSRSDEFQTAPPEGRREKAKPKNAADAAAAPRG